MEFDRRTKLESWQLLGAYRFKDIELLDIAFTHSSFVKGDGNAHIHNERLEFLGDAVLELCVSRYLYQHYPKMNEGMMTRIRALSVCENALYIAAKQLDIGKLLLLSRGEERTGGRDKPSILSDALEAVIGAIYLDGGMNAAETFILHFATDSIEASQKSISTKDWKTQLQEYAQKQHLGTVEYMLLKEDGPAHKREFTMCAMVNGTQMGCGVGASKQAAGQIAAQTALSALEQVIKTEGDHTENHAAE